MWFKLLLCFLVAFAYANDSPGWQDNYEYAYEVRGRLLTGLNQISNKYSGILLKGQLRIRPRPDGNLMGKLSSMQYADIHSSLKEAWEQQIPDGEIRYQELPVSSKPFKIVMKDGVVQDLVVDKNMNNWEANLIKGIVSQLQLNTDAKEDVMRSSINIFTQQSSETAVFKTMEKTVTGEAETLYEIHPLPEHIVKTSPWIAPLQQNQDLIEVVKSKNFTHSKQRPSYHFGFQGADEFEVANTIGEFFSRTSVTRAVLSGSLKSFTLQSAVTVDQVTVNPNLQDEQRGLTGSIVNITLHSMTPQSEEFDEASKTVHVGIIYNYDLPFAHSNEPRKAPHNSEESDEVYASSESGGNIYSERDSHAQDQPHLSEAPASPLLPFTVGYNGQAISMKQNIQENVRLLAKKIGQEFQDPDKMPEENTLRKFTVLSSLIRVMKQEQIKRVAQQLYTQERHGEQAAAWVAFRDAVAEAGTGPALLMIDQWISNQQVSESEAAELIATTTESARQPTEKYMQFIFRMVQNDQYMAQKSLNESLLLSYTSLIHEVYVNDEDSHSKFPVHSYKSFNTADGHSFIKREVIPYLTTKLNQAVTAGDTQKIHVYIRALGNIGQQQILSSFKPYLEGTKKMSQFQRVLMVMALDKLIQNNPTVARSVLYKIYQNPRDFEQVRVAAVFQLMRASPSPAMLQRMARYTNMDSNNQVNSAVKSAIEDAAKLQVPRLAKLRAAAQSAKNLLTPREFGVQNSKMSLKNYVVEQMQLEVKQILQTWGAEDCVLPKGLKYYLRGRFGGLKQSILNLEAVVSSVDDLMDVAAQQTKSYRQLLEQKQSVQSVNTKWSSEHTAKLLNMQNEQREQLEGYIHLHLNSMQKVLSFDNTTIENAVEILRQWEEELKSGKQYNYNKMSVEPEGAVSFPTAWGIPFIYTYDRPTFMHVRADVKSENKPSMYSQGGIRIPEIVDMEFKIHGFLSCKAQSEFGIFTPFNQRRYSAGYDKNFQLVLPELTGKVRIDVQKTQATIEMQNTDTRKNVNLVHFSAWPYTSQSEIYSTSKRATEIIQKEHPQRINTVVGDKVTGIALSLKLRSDKKIDYEALYEKLQDKDALGALLSSWFEDDINNVLLDIALNDAKSSTNKVTIHLGHQEKYFAGLNKRREFLGQMSHGSPICKESWERQNEFLKNSSQDISNVNAEVVDVSLEFQGENLLKYSATVGGTRSNSDPKSRLLMQAQKDCQNDDRAKIYFSAESRVPNPPSLNLESALNFDPTSTVQIEAGIENKNGRNSLVNANIQLSKSETRKEHLRNHRQYSQCQKQMAEGNNQLPACSILTTHANLLDRFTAEVNFRNIDAATANCSYKVYSMLRQRLYHWMSEDVIAREDSHKNKWTIEGQYNPDLSHVDAKITTEKARAEIRNLPMNPWWQNLFVAHPVHRLSTRAEGHALRNPEFQTKCVIDKSAINTLDNRTYPADLGKDWVVALHYVPRQPSPSRSNPDLSVVEQLNQQMESYILYARSSEADSTQKEIKMVIQSPNTLGKVIDITLKPSGSGYPRLFVQNEEVVYGDEGSNIYDDYMQVYKLPNNELKVGIYDAFGVVYDGIRAKITVMSDKFRDASRGLCGTYTGEEETDFTHPGNCIIRSPEVFVSSYIVPTTHRNKRMNDMLMIQAEEKKCYKKSVGYVKVISTRDSGLTGGDKHSMRKWNMIQKTRYVESEGQTCFSVEPLPACKPGMRERKTSAVVDAHCVQSSNVAALMKNQIDNHRNPSFKGKAINKRVTMEFAERCE